MLLRGTELEREKEKWGFVEASDDLCGQEQHEDRSEPANFKLGFAKAERIMKSIPHVISSNSFTYKDWLQMEQIAQSLETSNKK